MLRQGQSMGIAKGNVFAQNQGINWMFGLAASRVFAHPFLTRHSVVAPLPYSRTLPIQLFISVQAIAGSTTMSLTVSSHRRPSAFVLPVSYPPVEPSRRHELPWAAAVRRKASHGISLAHVMRVTPIISLVKRRVHHARVHRRP
jgi:hypothetical protein